MDANIDCTFVVLYLFLEIQIWSSLYALFVKNIVY